MTTMTKTKDAIALLKEDHKKVKKLFDDFEDSDSASEQQKICEQVIKELKVHTTIEEEIFYPAAMEALSGDEENEELLKEAKEEHRVAKTVIEALEALSPKDEDFKAKFIVLAENVRHHIKEEESEMFKELRGEDIDLEELGEQMMARKETLQKNESALKEAVATSEVKPYQELGKATEN